MPNWQNMYRITRIYGCVLHTNIWKYQTEKPEAADGRKTETIQWPKEQIMVNKILRRKLYDWACDRWSGSVSSSYSTRGTHRVALDENLVISY
jgi:hypothetical protein